MSAVQQVALQLHSLHAADRQWLLDHLPDTSAGQIKTLLSELEALGIPRSLPDLEPLLSEAVTPAVSEYSRLAARLKQVAVADMEVLAENEHTRVAEVLAALVALARNTSISVSAVAAIFESMPVHQRLAQRLAQELDTMLAERISLGGGSSYPVRQSVPRHVGLWQRLLPWRR